MISMIFYCLFMFFRSYDERPGAVRTIRPGKFVSLNETFPPICTRRATPPGLRKPMEIRARPIP